MKKAFTLALLAMLGVGSASAQEDITDQYLVNADLSTVNSGWTYFSESFKYTDWKTDGDVPVVEFYSQWNSGDPVSITQKDFKFSQTVTMPAGDYRIAVNAFYRNGRGDGTNPDKAWIFAGEKKQNVVALTSAGVASYSGSNDLYKAANAFSKGDFLNAFDFSLDKETEIELGFQGFFNTSLSWCILGPVKLYKYSLDDYLVDYRAKVAEAEALYNKPMNGDVLAALKEAVVDESTFTLGSEVTEAIQKLTAAINAANNSIAAYANFFAFYEAYNEAIAAAIENGAPTASETALDEYYLAYEELTMLDSEVDAKIAEMEAIVIAVIKQQTKDGSDMTFAIVNPSFETGNTNGWTYEASNDSGAKSNSNGTYAISNADGNFIFNIWPSGNPISQTITGLPNGVYTVKALIATDAGQKVQINGNDKFVQVDASADGKGVGVEGSVEFEVLDGTATIGAEGVNKYWYKVDNFRLTLTKYYDVELMKESYEAMVEEANALLRKPMYTEVRDALNEAVVDAETLTTYDEVVVAIEKLSAALTAAKASVAAYEKLFAALEDGNTFIAAAIANGAPTANETALDEIYSGYEEGTIADADIAAKLAEIETIVIGIAKQQTKEGSDMTRAIVNHSFETGDLTGWTVGSSSDTGVRANSVGNYHTEGCDGDYLFNTWWQGIPITQTIKGLPNGTYELKALMTNDAATAGDQPCLYLLANGEHSDAFGSDGKGVFAEQSMQFDITDGTATIGAVGGNTDGSFNENGHYWYKADNFRLTLVKPLSDAEVLEARILAINELLAKANALVEAGEGNETALSNLTAMITDVQAVIDNEAEKLLDDASYETIIAELTESIELVEASVIAGNVLPKMKELTESTNLYTEEAYEEYYGQWYQKYEAGTLTKAEAQALQDPFLVTGWHASNNVDDLLMSVWDAVPEAWDTYHINTWSKEGSEDGSNFTVPFFEYWTGDGDSLGEKTLTATMNGLEKGDYEVTALVRVRAKNGYETPVTGITFQANDGEAVDVTVGEQIGDSQFFLKEYTVEGTVAEDGVLKVKFLVAAGNNVSWLSFKNVMFTKKAAPALVGDVNNDGKVGIGDIVAITNFMAGIGAQTLEQCDVNGDGKVGIGDIVAVTNIMAGIEDKE